MPHTELHRPPRTICIKMNKINQDIAKKLITNLGIDTILHTMIEMLDDSIDIVDTDINSIRDSDDLWKFKVIEGLEYAYESCGESI